MVASESVSFTLDNIYYFLTRVYVFSRKIEIKVDWSLPHKSYISTWSGRASQKVKAYYGGSVDKKNSAPSTSQTHHEVTAYKGRPHYK